MRNFKSNKTKEEDEVVIIETNDKEQEEKTDVELMGEALDKLSLIKMPQEFYNEMNEIMIEVNEDKKKRK
tara:strand:+ start:4289 stop:4498 length:210 start_codon:yes stop_codon:yes gene_type:complete